MKSPFFKEEKPDSDSGKPEQEEESSLFKEDPKEEESVVEDDDVSEGLFAEGNKDKKTEPPKGLMKRLKQVIGQRNELRKQMETSERSRSELQGRVAALDKIVDAHTKMLGTAAKRYSKYEEPDKALSWDADFMDALERLSKADSEVAKVAERIKATIGQGPDTMTEDTTTKTSEKEATQKEDPRVAKLIRKTATATINATLEDAGVKKSMHKVFRDHILNSENVDLEDLDETQVVELTKEYIKENELTREDVLGSGKQSSRPATQSSSGKAADTKPQEDGEGNDKPGPKDITEWRRNRDKRLTSFIGSLS